MDTHERRFWFPSAGTHHCDVGWYVDQPAGEAPCAARGEWEVVVGGRCLYLCYEHAEAMLSLDWLDKWLLEHRGE